MLAVRAERQGLLLSQHPYRTVAVLRIIVSFAGLEHFAGAAHADKILTWSGIHQRKCSQLHTVESCRHQRLCVTHEEWCVSFCANFSLAR